MVVIFEGFFVVIWGGFEGVGVDISSFPNPLEVILISSPFFPLFYLPMIIVKIVLVFCKECM